MFMRSVLGIAVIVPLVACSGNTDVSDVDAQTSTTAAAVIVVERSGSGDAIVARFVRARQGTIDDVSLRSAGVQDLPVAGTCETSAPPSAARAVDLLDVGALTVVDDARRTMLVQRSMPDPAGMVSGTFYSARSTDVYAPAQRVWLQASGGQDLPDGFSIGVATPRDLSDVRVAAANGGVELTWDDSDPRDLVYVDVLSRETSTLARCAEADVGRLVVPSSVLGNVDEGSLAVHRVHREAFRARGIDPGEVRFDFSRIVAFRR